MTHFSVSVSSQTVQLILLINGGGDEINVCTSDQRAITLKKIL